MICGFTAAWASGIDYPTYQPPHSEREEGRGYKYIDAEKKEHTTFSSTSIEMSGAQTASREYFVPVSALTVTGGVTTEDGESEDSDRPRVRRIGGRPGAGTQPVEDIPSPIGDSPWLLMVLLGALYAVYRARNTQKVK